jgi:predicted regulator of Ras-like GTPase activity (Roadblock/LC7/MglB family)
MLQFFKNLFRKPAVLPTARIPRISASQQQQAFMSLPQVEIASLSLRAIIERFPADLKKGVVTIPDAEVMVALPVPTIVKQLPSGSVKMSLASVYRQAPAGTFSETRVEDKRMVEVPLGEIFKRVRPDLLRRRGDQRQNELAEDGIDVFGDKDNPYAIAPTVAATQTPHSNGSQAPALQFSPNLEESTEFDTPTSDDPAVANETGEPLKLSPTAMMAETAASPSGPAASPAAAPAPAPLDQTPFFVSLKDVSENWPAAVRAELGTIDGAQVGLPAGEVGAGLAKGRLAFTWGRLREWITPAVESASQTSEETELQLPLRVVAPAFLKASRRSKERKSFAIDETIPALFSGGRSAEAPAASGSKPLAAPAAAPTVPHSAPVAPPSVPVAPPKFVLAEPPAVPTQTAKPVSIASADPARRAAQVPASAATPSRESASEEKIPRTLGEVFGQPERPNWTPGEIVQHAVQLPQLAGAIIALQEGLVVSHKLPEGMKGEVVAAFLPQIFGRLNQYSTEMKLGEIDEVLLSAQGAYFQAFRAGQVFFAVLGKQGQTLPWHALRLMADDLLQQTKK